MRSIANIKNRNTEAMVYIVGGKSFNKSVQEIIYESYYRGIDFETYAFNEIADNKEVKGDFQHEAFISNKKNLDFTYINMMDNLCDSGKCSILTKENVPFYYDRVHTTRIGAKYLGLKIKGSNIFPSDFYL